MVDWNDRKARDSFLGDLVEKARGLLSMASSGSDNVRANAELLSQLLLQDIEEKPAPVAATNAAPPAAGHGAGDVAIRQETVPDRAPSATDPEQQLATDLQSIMNQLQGTQTGSTQTASAEQTGATGPAHGHHHHHLDTDTDASAATEASATTTPATTTAAANNQTVSQTFAADIMQALQAYGDTGSTVTATALTA